MNILLNLNSPNYLYYFFFLYYAAVNFFFFFLSFRCRNITQNILKQFKNKQSLRPINYANTYVYIQH